MKTILSIVLTLVALSVSAQTATISFNEDSYWTMYNTNSETIAQIEHTYAITRLFNFKIEDDRNREDISTEHSRNLQERTVETQSETWSLRNKENLIFQICRDYTSHHFHDSTTISNLLHIGTVQIDIRTIEVYDILGRVVHSTGFQYEVNRISLDHLSEGIYYLVLRNEDQNPLYSQKLAIK